MTVAPRRLGRRDLAASRLGLGLAALGRPAYITLGRAHDLGPTRDVETMAARAAAVCDAAWDAGVRYVDVARSYGRAEEFLARWLAARGHAPGALTVGSKWGYAYTGGWRLDATTHEEKALTLPRFRAQLAESRALLGAHLALYQVHSATLESGVLDDAALLAAMVAERGRSYRAVGLTLTGARAADTLRAALAATALGEPVFDVVQATVNVLEPSLAPLLAAARAAGVGVVAKEVHANGRLTPANERPEDAALRARLQTIAARAGLVVDQLALAWVAAQPGVDVVLSGAATPAQLASHAAALDVALDAATLDELAGLAEPPEIYWRTRAALPWS